jgi:hypothetical protein
MLAVMKGRWDTIEEIDDDESTYSGDEVDKEDDESMH